MNNLLPFYEVPQYLCKHCGWFVAMNYQHESMPGKMQLACHNQNCKGFKVNYAAQLKQSVRYDNAETR